VGGVGTQQRVEQVAGEGGREGRVAVEAEAVDEGLGGAEVRRVDVVGRQIGLLDRVAQTLQAVDLPQGPGLVLREAVAEGLADLLDLGVRGDLSIAERAL
jgi:hypothetical protein